MTHRSRSRLLLAASLGLPLASALVVGAKATLALRSNNLEMLKLRDAVLKADETGVGVPEALLALQRHVAAHMNATPPKLGKEPAIQLKFTYDRAKKAEETRVTSLRETIYNEGIAYCEATLPRSLLSDRARCIIDYSTSRPVTEATIVPDLYRYDFVSPKWTPDVAGWSIVITVVLLVIVALQVVVRSFARLLVLLKLA